MRNIALILATAAIAGCTTGPAQPTRTAQNQAKYESILAGKVEGKPLSCLPTMAGNNMQVIDESTLLFRQTPNKVYVSHMNGPCANVDVPGYALVSKQYGAQGLCSGDIATVVDTSNGMTTGSCVFGDFVPYEKA
jgi:hypothetical protein